MSSSERVLELTGEEPRGLPAVRLLWFDIASETHRGTVRSENQDYILVDHAQQLVILCDGVGGAQAGALAAAESAVFVREALLSDPVSENPDAPKDWVKAVSKALRGANDHLNGLAASNPDHAGMGTTCTLLMGTGNGLVLGHVGDSRCYRWAGRKLQQLTEDETTDDIARRFFGLAPDPAGPGRATSRTLAQVIGTDATRFFPAVALQPAENGDLFLLCSDGLTGSLSEAAIAAVLSRADAPLQGKCSELVARAVAAHAQDNVSAVLVRIGRERPLHPVAANTAQGSTARRLFAWKVTTYVLVAAAAIALLLWTLR